MIKHLLLLPVLSTSILSAYSGLNIDEIRANDLGFTSTEAYLKYKANEGPEYLTINNCEDYIYIPDDETEYDEDDPARLPLIEQFEEYMKTTEGRDVHVIYDTYDTNENLFNDLKTGKKDYDIIMPSDYMIQKMISENMLQKLDTKQAMPNVDETLSPYLKEVFAKIDTKRTNEKGEEVTESISEYALPYMWGTVGMMYNPDYPAYQGAQDIHADFSTYDVLYDKYKGTASIKDSVRDLYAIGVVHIEKHKQEITAAQKVLNEILDDESKSEIEKEAAVDAYQVFVNELFNRNDDETLLLVQNDLIALKNNSFGFEVDQGKNDMISGMIGANIAWSGDAVYAINEARGKGMHIYFSLPTLNTASNIWFDGMCVPKWTNGRDNEHLELAMKFMDFVYMPEKAAMNMDYIGYTPGAAGEDILALVQANYDIRYNEETEELDDSLLEGLVEGEDYVKYDLSYFFEGTVDEECETVIYADIEDSMSTLQAQFPEQDQLKYLAVMKDFGDRNTAALDMWENVKTSPIPVFVIVILAVEGGAALALVLYFVISKNLKKKLRKARGKAK